MSKKDLLGSGDIICQKFKNEKPICGVYFLINNNSIVYVGKSKNVFLRIEQHRSQKEKEFDSYFFIDCGLEYMAQLESDYIAKFIPKYNKTFPFDGTTYVRAGSIKHKNSEVNVNGIVFDGKLYIDTRIKKDN